jgi:hypothetical protein
MIPSPTGMVQVVLGRFYTAKIEIRLCCVIILYIVVIVYNLRKQILECISTSV